MAAGLDVTHSKASLCPRVYVMAAGLDVTKCFLHPNKTEKKQDYSYANHLRFATLVLCL